MGFLTPEAGFGKDSGIDEFVPVEALENMKPYPGIDYLGVGYDIYHGNPEGDEISMTDPGFRQPIRTVSYTGVTMTRDNRYLTPDGSVTMPLSACSRSEKASDVATQSRYANSLTEDVSEEGSTSENLNAGVSFGVGSASAGIGSSSHFSSSGGMRQQASRERSKKYYRIEVKSYCNKVSKSNFQAQSKRA